MAAVGRVLMNGVAGRRLLEAAAYADAEADYAAALEAVGMHGSGGVPARDSA